MRDRVYGHIAALVAHGGAYRLRLDPARLTTGVTANVAAAEDGVVEPGEPVPNDNYRVEERHRLLTYVGRSRRARHRADEGRRPGRLRLDSRAGARTRGLVAGEPVVELFEPLDTGVWVRLRGDTACAIDQQYLP